MVFMQMVDEHEDGRAAGLLDAQAKAVQLFAAVERDGLIAPGVTEMQASDAISALATEMLGVRRFWHKRIVRAGVNTLLPYRRSPPDRVIGEDDIAFADFGPIFEGWEADFGRTFVLGDDPAKHRICDALPVIFAAGRAYFESRPDISGAELYAHVVDLTQRAGWDYGGPHSGHLVGRYPHEKIAGADIESYIAPGSDRSMRRDDEAGNSCHWILEIHLVDHSRQFGAFYEELLDL
jgi:Xaa-Pro aminopeptidase